MATESQTLAITNQPRTFINELSQHVGEEVTIKGWLYNLRSSGKILFPQLRDGTGVVQCVALKSSLAPEVWDSLKGLGQESALAIRGTVREDSRAPGGYEIDLVAAEIFAEVHDYPITPKEHGTEFLMDHRHLWLRSRRQHAVLKVRHTVVKAVRDFLDDDGFTLADAPIFTPAACEGTTTLFEVDYFEGEKAYLTQSGQLYNEATAAALGKVYCFGPTFRAEKSKTRRHLTEFWMVEPEVAYATVEDMMDLSERMIAIYQDYKKAAQPQYLAPPAPPAQPLKLDLGCGIRKQPGHVDRRHVAWRHGGPRAGRPGRRRGNGGHGHARPGRPGRGPDSGAASLCHPCRVRGVTAPGRCGRSPAGRAGPGWVAWASASREHRRQRTRRRDRHDHGAERVVLHHRAAGGSRPGARGQ